MRTSRSALYQRWEHATGERKEVLRRPVTRRKEDSMITETRISSVDALPELPGYQPITMHELWVIANKASDVVLAARQHLESYDEATWEILGSMRAV